MPLYKLQIISVVYYFHYTVMNKNKQINQHFLRVSLTSHIVTVSTVHVHYIIITNTSNYHLRFW